MTPGTGSVVQMTEGVKDDGRRGWFGKKSRSNIGGSAYEKVTQELEPEHLLKTKSWKEKQWFRSKSQTKGSFNGHDLQGYSETTDLEPAEEKPMQRTVQGFYRDDDGGPSPTILQTSVSAARDALKEFSKDFVTQMKAKPDLCAALEDQMQRQLSIEPAAPIADLKFLVQAYTVLHLFSGFENASFGISNPGEKPWEVDQHMATCFGQFKAFRTKSETISKLLENKAGNSFLSEFCTRKFKSLIPVDLENAMFGADCEYHGDLLDQRHPNNAFYRSFLSAAVSVWLLQRLRFSFEQKVITISPTRGDEFQRRFMLPAVPGTGDNGDEASDRGLEVLYTVFPGFRVGESIVKSLVLSVEKSMPPTTEAETAMDQTLSTTETVAAEDQTASSVDDAAREEEIVSTVNLSAIEEAPERNPTYLKMDSLPVTPSTRKEEGSKMKGPKKSLSSRETSDIKGPKSGFFQRFRNLVLKKSSKKAKAADNFSSPAVPPSVNGEPPAYQRTPTATTFVGGKPAGTPAGTASVEGELAAHRSNPTPTVPVEDEPRAHQRIPTATASNEGKPASTPAGTASVEGELAAHRSNPTPTAPVEDELPAHQRIPTATASNEDKPASTPVGTASVEGELAAHRSNPTPTAPVEDEPPAHQRIPTATASNEGKSASTPTGTAYVEGELATHQSTPTTTALVEGEPTAHQSNTAATTFAESAPVARDTPAAAPVQGEIFPVEEAPSSGPAPSIPPPKDGEIDVSSSPSPEGPPLNTLD